MTVPDAVIGGRYRLVRRLAAGGMGSVWEGWDERLQRPVAVKQLLVQPGLSKDESELASQRVMREARITARLHHPHAVPVYDVVDQDGLPCLIMQFLPSSSLHEVLRDKGTLAANVVAGIGADIASALAAAHQAGIVHRDVKPGNVLITEDGSAKLTDFGVSHAVGDVHLTSTGLVTGTPAFLAPEVARGAESAFSADVFSLGATLYAATEGMPPFGTDDNPMAMLHKVASGAVIPPQRSGPLAPLLMRMLATDPAARPPAIDVARTLAALSADLGPAGNAQLATQRVVAPIPVQAQQLQAPTATLPAATPAVGSAAAGSRRDALPPVVPPGRTPPVRPAGAPPPERRRRPVAALAALAAAAVLVLALVLGLLLLGHRNSNDTAQAPPSTVPHTSAPRTSSATSAAGSSAVTSAQDPSTQASASSVASSSQPPSSPAASTPGAGAGAPTAAQLAQAINDYYALLPSDTDSAWKRLTKSYQQGTAQNRKYYDSYWDSIQRVTVAGVSGSPPSSAQATVTYYFKDGRVVVEQTSYGLVSDDGTLKIDSSQVTSSQTQ
jgi:serine/threonine protein kinase